MKCSYCKCKIVDRGFNIIIVCMNSGDKLSFNEDEAKI